MDKSGKGLTQEFINLISLHISWFITNENSIFAALKKEH